MSDVLSDSWIREIDRLTVGVRALRIVHQLIHRGSVDVPDIAKMKPLPPLSGVAGLGNIFKDAARAIEEIKESGQYLESEASALAADIMTVREHVRKEHEDFHFKVSTLGNGGETVSDKEGTGSLDSSATFQAGTRPD